MIDRVESIKGIRRVLGVEGDLASKIFDAMCNAKSYGEQLAGMYSPEITHKEYREEMTSLSTWLCHLAHEDYKPSWHTKALNRLNKIPAQNQQVLDLYYWELHKDDRLMSMMIEPDTSAFSQVLQTVDKLDQAQINDECERLHQVVKYAISQISKPGRGKSRNITNKTTASLEHYARDFSELFPDSPISYTQRSIFFNHAVFFLNEFLGLETSDPTRHIKNMLNKAQRIAW